MGFIMQWKHYLLIAMFITNCIQLTEAQRYYDYDIYHPGRRGETEDSTVDDYYGALEEYEAEATTTASKSSGLEIHAGPININFRVGNGQNRSRGSGRGRGRNHHPHDSESEDNDTPSGRAIGGKGERRDREHQIADEESEDHGPCGKDNILCHGENYVKELGLKWKGSGRIHNGTGIFLLDPNAPNRRKFVPIGIEQPNEVYGKCKTPDNQEGGCRHLEHCVLDDFRSNFVRFLEYQCDIPNKNFVGVCCPKDTKKEEPRTRFPDTGFPFDSFPIDLPPLFRRTTTTTRPPKTRRTTSRPRSRDNPNRRTRPRGCGERIKQRIESRIVGGRISDPNEWPWMAALLKKTEAVDYRAGQYCGGVLISEFHVLTAAHCVDGFNAETLAVRIGEYDFARPNSTNSANPQDIDVLEIFIHENFNRYTYKNDIAVLKLVKSAFFDDRIINVCLPSTADLNNTLTNERAIVTGFGTIYYGGPASDKLMELTIPIWDHQDCKAAYTQPIEETNLCAGEHRGSFDSCQGDSGGPLQMQLRGRWTTVGIVSWGIRCAEPGYPGVYTRVSKYINWIVNRMRK